jgi:predicted metal-dependent phosphoesterase TrpH
MRIDLHVHSTASDGTDPPAEVMRRASEAGVDIVALTDHDTVAGHEEARQALPDGLTLVPGMELSCQLDGQSVHLLAYLFEPSNEALAAECQKIREDRDRRAREMVTKLAELGTEVTWNQVAAVAGDSVVGRPHIARAMVEAGVIDTHDQAFTPEWIGEGGRAYAARYAPDPIAAIHLISAAGGVSVLAHPRITDTDGWTASDATIARLATAGLTGIEVWHPAQEAPERDRLLLLASELGLVASGGSDDHGTLTEHRIGSETIPPHAYERLISQATGAIPVPGHGG